MKHSEKVGRLDPKPLVWERTNFAQRVLNLKRLEVKPLHFERLIPTREATP
jgi:hypothetical protein